MNLDVLISKYIDGELSVAEDETLRRLLKEDPIAKEEFDSFLELHLAMINDADSIMLPASVKRETEDKIMMNILKDIPNIKPIKKPYNTYYRVASLAIFFLFIALFQTSDQFFYISEFSADDSQLLEDNTTNNKKTTANIVGKTIKNTNNYKNRTIIIKNTADVANTNTIAPINADNDYSNLANATNTIVSQQAPTTPEQRVTSFDNLLSHNGNDNNSIYGNGYNTNSNKIQVINSHISSINHNALNDFSGFLNYADSEINLTTTMSYDFARNGFNTYDNTAIKNYSQSISYSIDKDIRVGIEFGLSEFDYPNTKFIKVRSSNNSNAMVEVLDPNSGDYILVPIQVKETEKNYWGTIFYEQNLFNYNNFAIDGRVGLGGNSDGMVAMSRVVAKYNLLYNLYLSAGAEARSFNYNLPLKNTKGTINNLSFVWGIYFQF
ncbi:MAG TPA: hypothetical protein PLE30_08005 [Candidatus Kapabacteria bacterium]|nr:hypothetical protein [Candidatus Kapabacteria bacterium]